MHRIYKDKFGFFIHDFNLHIGPYVIDPVKKHEAATKRINDCIYDGFLYPPMIYVNNDAVKPHHVYWCPPSHTISLANKKQLAKDFREKDGRLIIFLLGFIYGCRAMFHDWKFDTRLPMKQDGIAIFNYNELEMVVNNVYSEFLTWGHEAQDLFMSILYINSRNPAYEWDWEQFIMEYAVTDAIWKFCTFSSSFDAHIKKTIKGKLRHEDRIWLLCDYWKDVPYKQHEVERIVKYRNEIFHEAWWNKEILGFSTDSTLVEALFNLRKLNQRFIMRAGGVTSEFTRSDWTSKSRGSLI